jgi:hypothetical protein
MCFFMSHHIRCYLDGQRDHWTPPRSRTHILADCCSPHPPPAPHSPPVAQPQLCLPPARLLWPCRMRAAGQLQLQNTTWLLSLPSTSRALPISLSPSSPAPPPLRPAAAPLAAPVAAPVAAPQGPSPASPPPPTPPTPPSTRPTSPSLPPAPAPSQRRATAAPGPSAWSAPASSAQVTWSRPLAQLLSCRARAGQGGAGRRVGVAQGRKGMGVVGGGGPQPPTSCTARCGGSMATASSTRLGSTALATMLSSCGASQGREASAGCFERLGASQLRLTPAQQWGSPPQLVSNSPSWASLGDAEKGSGQAVQQLRSSSGAPASGRPHLQRLQLPQQRRQHWPLVALWLQLGALHGHDQAERPQARQLGQLAQVARLDASALVQRQVLQAAKPACRRWG